jgi:monothiol glutaredoxin
VVTWYIKPAMSRPILDESKIHPAIREKIATQHADIVREVRAAVEANDVVVVGMRMNPNPKRAIKALRAAGVKHTYLEYGSYFSEWRRRAALKLWTGWQTFPMVFVKGTLIGGADDTEKLIANGELTKMIDEKSTAAEAKAN